MCEGKIFSKKNSVKCNHNCVNMNYNYTGREKHAEDLMIKSLYAKQYIFNQLVILVKHIINKEL